MTELRIVSGHQRLAILDTLEHRKDYQLDVAVVDWDDKTEKEMVVFLNNEQAMGSYDMNLLDTLLKDNDLDFLNCGFDESFLKVALPSFEPPMSKAQKEQEDEVIRTAQDVENAEAAAVGAIKQRKKVAVEEANQARPEDANAELYVALVFRDRPQRDRFLNRLRLNVLEKYISGEMVLQALDREGPEPGRETWVPLSEVFESGRIPEAAAKVAQQAIAGMRAAGDLGDKNAWQAIEFWAADWLSGAKEA